MKFWKSILFTFVLFCAVVTVVVYSSCEQDNCLNVTCNHGGSCKSGICSCPTGFEGPTCSDSVITRYYGYYAGYSTCNNGAEVIDTVFVYYVSRSSTELKLVQKNHIGDTLIGTVSNSASTYDILIPEKLDSNYSKTYNATLQSDNTFILNSYERDLRIPGDTISNKCTFLGTKHLWSTY